MPILRAQISLGSETGLPEDDATNTFHFDATGTASTTLENVRDLLFDFYTVDAGDGAIGSLMSEELSDGTVSISIYNLDDSVPRIPIFIDSTTFTPSANPGLPPEVALCLSFQGPQASGQPQARRRGRVYLPWFTEAANVAGRPAAAWLTAIQTQAQALLDASDASVSVDWVVYSPTNDAAYGVDNGWVDNAWDTQRRRGWGATSRVTFS